MSVTIEKIGVVVPGQVVRKYDTEADETTLTLTGDQVLSMLSSLGTVRSLFNGPNAVQNNTPKAEENLNFPKPTPV